MSFFWGTTVPIAVHLDTRQERADANSRAAGWELLNWILPASARDSWDMFLIRSGISALVVRRKQYDWWEIERPFNPLRLSASPPQLKWACFLEHDTISRITFGQSVSLTGIPREAFADSALRSIHIPDTVQSLDDNCFCRCERLSRVTFGRSSSLKIIGNMAFYASGLKEVHLPDSVESLGEKCFWRCRKLTCVTFGELSSLKSICADCFTFCPIKRFTLPPKVDYISGAPFNGCPLTDFVISDPNSPFTLFGCLLLEARVQLRGCVGILMEIVIPDSVEILREKCFCDCTSLVIVIFGECSRLRMMGSEAFARSGLMRIDIPDRVKSIGDKCFYACERLVDVTFGENSRLRVIGHQAFYLSGLVGIHLPPTVEAIGNKCFGFCIAPCVFM